MKFNNLPFLKILFLSISVIYSFKSYSKQDETIKITGNYNENLSEFFNEIGKSNNISFFFQPEWFDSIVINKSYTNASINDVFNDLFKKLPFQYYSIQKNSIIILPKDQVLKVLSKSSFQTNTTENSLIVVGKLEDIGKVKRPEIHGKIIDGKNGEPIIGATIIVQNTTTGSASDTKGNFTLTLTPGIYNLIVSSIGYEPKTYSIKLIGNGDLNFEIFEQSIRLGEVIISAQKADKNVKSNQMSLVELDRKTIKQLPSLFGSKDVIKSLTMMPGVSSVGEFGAGINVRGGSNDQNLFLMEGSPIFNSSHVFGLISVINPDAVNNVALFKGYIPQNYGERVSSIMDIQLKEGDYKKIHASGGIGLLDSRLMIESPIVADKASIIISARSSYSDWLLKQDRMPDEDLRKSSASFYDLNTTVSFITNTKNKFTLFGYFSNDYFQYSTKLIYKYNNYLGSISWEHKFSDKLNSKLVIATSKYSIYKDNIDEVELKTGKNRVKTGIKYNSLKLDFNYSPNTSNTLSFGTQVIHYSNNAGVQTHLDTLSIPYPIINNEQAIETALYLGDKYDITEKLSIQAGIRASAYAYLGPNQITQYQQGLTKSINSKTEVRNYNNGEIIQQYTNLEPRASLKYVIAETNSVKISYSQNAQYLNLVSYTSIPTPDDVWKLSSNYIQPMKCQQTAIGYFQNFKQNKYETSFEVYYKKLSNLLDYKNGVNISMNNSLETGLINTKGTNYGFEVLLKKNIPAESTGIWDGWISYTYSRSLKQTYSSFSEEQINKNTVYPSSYDRPHNLIVLATYHYNRRIRLSFNYNYSSGRSVTLPEQKFIIREYGPNNTIISEKTFVQYSDRNKYRLPNYKRLDVSLSIDETLYHKRKWKGSWTISVINVLANDNIYSVIYNSENSGTSALYKMLIINQPLPILTYNFIF